MYGSDGSHFEVEKDEAFAIVNRRNAPMMLRMLSRINSLNGNGDPFYERGGVRYATGGLPTVNTTLAYNLPGAGAAPVASDGEGYAMLAREFAAFWAEASQWQRTFKVVQVYSEVERVAKTVSTITSEASL